MSVYNIALEEEELTYFDEETGEEVSPGSPITLAPGSEILEAIKSFINNKIVPNRTDSDKKLFERGLFYISLKRAYAQYIRVCIEDGLDKDEIETYEEFKTAQVFRLDSKSNISQLVTVAKRYILDYGLGSYKAKHENGIDYLELTGVSPVLLNLAHYRLYKLMPFHKTMAEAVEILEQAANMPSKSEFWKWLYELKGLTPKQAKELVAEQDNEIYGEVPIPKVYRKTANGYDIDRLTTAQLFGDQKLDKEKEYLITLEEIVYGQH